MAIVVLLSPNESAGPARVWWGLKTSPRAPQGPEAQSEQNKRGDSSTVALTVRPAG